MGVCYQVFHRVFEEYKHREKQKASHSKNDLLNGGGEVKFYINTLLYSGNSEEWIGKK